MNATEEWLRYIENDAIKKQYGIVRYDSDKPEEEENLEEESTKDSDTV